MISPEIDDILAKMHSGWTPEGPPRSGYTFETLRYEDIDEYRELMLSVMASSPTSNPQGLQEQIGKRTRQYYEEAFDNSLERGGIWTLLTSRDPDGNLAGVLEGKVSTDRRQGLTTGFVNWVCTEPGHQRQGVARGLYNKYAQILKKERPEITFMKAFVDNENADSLRFHQNYGFDLLVPYGSNTDKTGKWYIRAIRPLITEIPATQSMGPRLIVAF